jgi:protein arginine kinase
VTLAPFIRRPPLWMTRGEGSEIAVSSRVRLARNIADAAFPDRAGEEERVRLWERLREALCAAPALAGAVAVDYAAEPPLHRQLLFERHLVSREHAGRGRGSGLVVREDERLSAMVNEEDHLRLQALSPGLGLLETWRRVNALDDEVDGRVAYAFSPRLGYLTACPSNVGTGIHASVMLHLPALVLLGEIEPIVKGAHKIGLAVRGLWGEGTDAAGNMFQVSNQVTLGEREEAIVGNLEQIVLEIVEHEENARARLLRKKTPLLRDRVGRAAGILTQAHLLSTKEALDQLSALRLGMETGILPALGKPAVDELLLFVQPAHMQMLAGKRLRTSERDEARAEMVRTRLAGALRAPRRRRKTDE